MAVTYWVGLPEESSFWVIVVKKALEYVRCKHSQIKTNKKTKPKIKQQQSHNIKYNILEYFCYLFGKTTLIFQ